MFYRYGHTARKAILYSNSSAGDACRVEARILARAGQQTSGQLRAVLARAILAIDPAAAQRRREQAQKDPRVRRWAC